MTPLPKDIARERCREILPNLALFAGLPAEALDELAISARLQLCSAQQTLYRQDDPSDAVFIVESGAILLGRGTEGADGRKVAVHWMTRGDLFGEMEFLECQSAGQEPPTRQMRAWAATPSAFLELSGEAFRQALGFPSLATRLGALAAQRHRRLSEILTRQSLIGLVEIRLAQATLDRARALGRRDGPVIRLSQRMTHQQMGDLIGADRRSVLETLRLWEEAGLVRMDADGGMSLLDRRGLEAIAAMRSGQRNSWDAESWLGLIDGSLAAGDNAQAFEEALEALRRAGLSRHRGLQHRAVLAAARAGAIGRAFALLDKFGFDAQDPDDEIAALAARLFKDLGATGQDPAEAARWTERAAAAYRAIYRRSGNPYPGINAATLTLLSGGGEAAAAIAGSLPPPEEGAEGDRYFACATEAEKSLLIGDPVAAIDWLERAARARDANAGAIAVTRRQIARLGSALSLDCAALLSPLAQGCALFYAGHIMTQAAFPAAAQHHYEGRLRDLIDRHLGELQVGWAFGALSCGADIIIAEQLIERGARLCVVLPQSTASFVAESVLIGGAGWQRRFQNCLERAHRVIELDLARADPDRKVHLGNRFAMGLARRKGMEMMADSIMLTVWDGSDHSQTGGTGHAVADWREAGGEVLHLPCPWPHAPANNLPAKVPLCAILMVTGSGALAPAAPYDSLLLDPETILYFLPDAGEAVAAAHILAERAVGEGRQWRLVLDIAPDWGKPEDRAACCDALRQQPQGPANLPFATERFAAEAALIPASFALDYGGRVSCASSEGPVPIYLLRSSHGPTSPDWSK